MNDLDEDDGWPELPAEPIEESTRCPYLGLVWQPASTYVTASMQHRCFAEGKDVTVDHQVAYCLISSFPSCPIYESALLESKRTARDCPPPGTTGLRTWIIVIAILGIAFMVGVFIGLLF